jgi:hypothetical protein
LEYSNDPTKKAKINKTLSAKKQAEIKSTTREECKIQQLESENQHLKSNFEENEKGHRLAISILEEKIQAQDDKISRLETETKKYKSLCKEECSEKL